MYQHMSGVCGLGVCGCVGMQMGMGMEMEMEMQAGGGSALRERVLELPEWMQAGTWAHGTSPTPRYSVAVLGVARKQALNCSMGHGKLSDSDAHSVMSV